MSAINRKQDKIEKADALFREGLRFQEGGNRNKAIAHYRKAVQAAPNFCPALNNMAIALWETGQAQQALVTIKKSIKLEPANPATHNTRGLIETSLRHYPQAEKSFMAALKIKQDYPACYFNLARLYFLQGKWPETLRATERLLSFGAHQSGQLLKLTAQAELGFFDDINAQGEEFLKGLPQNLFLQFLKARILFLCGDIEGSLVAYDAALSGDPDYALALKGKASSLIEAGDKDAAAACLKRVLDNDPSYVGALRLLQGITPKDKSDEIYAYLKAADQYKQSLPPQECAELAYGWAKYFADQSDCEKAFSNWQKGGAYKNEASPYNKDKQERAVEKIKTIFEKPFPAKDCEDSVTPVFIIGMPRSGTSLMEQILSSHDTIRAGGELMFMKNAVGKLGDYNDTIDEAAVKEIGARYLEALAGRCQDAAFVTDKMPHNYFYLGFIAAALPQAKIIHMQRNPMDTCLSCFSTLFYNGHDWSYDLDSLGHYYRCYDNIMTHWRSVLPNNFIDVRYEDLVLDLEGKTKDVLNYCELDWDENCLSFHENKRAVMTASMHQVRTPLYNSSVNRWKKYEDQLAPLYDMLSDIMDKHGYEL